MRCIAAPVDHVGSSPSPRCWPGGAASPFPWPSKTLKQRGANLPRRRKIYNMGPGQPQHSSGTKGAFSWRGRRLWTGSEAFQRVILSSRASSSDPAPATAPEPSYFHLLSSCSEEALCCYAAVLSKHVSVRALAQTACNVRGWLRATSAYVEGQNVELESYAFGSALLRLNRAPAVRPLQTRWQVRLSPRLRAQRPVQWRMRHRPPSFRARRPPRLPRCGVRSRECRAPR